MTVLPCREAAIALLDLVDGTHSSQHSSASLSALLSKEMDCR
ncbi:hypothetical protein [Microcoleus sp. FACHB-SPT15]|nr:hypothetical protein [Microcoleus sp. FACHB-SPT15]